MHAVSRIPKLREISSDGALQWFSKLSCEGLLFHSANAPDAICQMADNQKVFSDAEVTELRYVIDVLDTGIDHDSTIEPAYTVFLSSLRMQMDA